MPGIEVRQTKAKNRPHVSSPSLGKPELNHVQPANHRFVSLGCKTCHCSILYGNRLSDLSSQSLSIKSLEIPGSGTRNKKVCEEKRRSKDVVGSTTLCKSKEEAVELFIKASKYLLSSGMEFELDTGSSNTAVTSVCLL